MRARPTQIVLAAAAAVAVLMPLLLLMPAKAPVPPGKAEPSVPIDAAAPPPLAAVYERPLFGGASAGESAPSDAPELAGVVGRLGEDAVALVRTADGTTRALRIGDSIDGWRLESLAIDAAFFTRGSERVRVGLPTAE